MARFRDHPGVKFAMALAVADRPAERLPFVDT
jgi:hypothetical protein